MSAFTPSSVHGKERNMQSADLQKEKESGVKRRRRGRANEHRKIEQEYSRYVLLCSFPGKTIKARSPSLSAARPPSLSPLSLLLLLRSNHIPPKAKATLSITPIPFISTSLAVPCIFAFTFPAFSDLTSATAAETHPDTLEKQERRGQRLLDRRNKCPVSLE